MIFVVKFLDCLTLIDAGHAHNLTAANRLAISDPCGGQ
jgi:hypothetical protein